MEDLARLRPRCGLTKVEIGEVEECLKQIIERDGRVTPESFLEAATPEDSKLHRFFEWDDKEAALQHRLHRARQIVRSVIYIPNIRDEPVQERLYELKEPSKILEVKVTERLPAFVVPDSIDGGTAEERIKSAAEAIEQVLNQLKGMDVLASERRMIRELVEDLRKRAPWIGKQCPKCHLMGHQPGSKECTNLKSHMVRQSE